MSALRVLNKNISAAALRHNWRQIRRQAHARRLLAVLKSDAYGHGLIPVARLLAEHADGFAVVRAQDAVILRQQGIAAPIVLLQGLFHADSTSLLAEYQLTPVIHSSWQIQALAAAAAADLTVYLKINTGMNRLGFAIHEAAAAIEALQQIPAVTTIVLMTHFADGETSDGLDKPLQHIARLREAYRLPFSLGNSAASLLHGDIGDDIGRIGIALYGASPAAQIKSARDMNLQPVMTFTTKLIALHQVAAGERIGYNGQYVTAADMTIGVASVGYGDGYPRRNGLTAAINGVAAPVIGRVSMEMITLDLTAHADAAIGDTVTLWGDTPAVDDVAAAADTIAYDLLTAAKGEYHLID